MAAGDGSTHLTVNISTDGDRSGYRLNVGLLQQQITNIVT